MNLASRSVYEHRPIAKQAIERILGLGKPFRVVAKSPATFSFLNVIVEYDEFATRHLPGPIAHPSGGDGERFRQELACFLTANRNACAMAQATLVRLE